MWLHCLPNEKLTFCEMTGTLIFFLYSCIFQTFCNKHVSFLVFEGKK